MPMENNRGDFWKGSPNMAAFGLITLTLVLCLAFLQLKVVDLTSQVSQIRVDADVYRAKMDERDKASRERDAQIMSTLIDTAKKNSQISEQLNRIANNMVITDGGRSK